MSFLGKSSTIILNYSIFLNWAIFLFSVEIWNDSVDEKHLQKCLICKYFPLLWGLAAFYIMLEMGANSWELGLQPWCYHVVQKYLIWGNRISLLILFCSSHFSHCCWWMCQQTQHHNQHLCFLPMIVLFLQAICTYM